MRIVLAVAAIVLAAPALPKPSFDCAHASNEAEKAICEAPALQWFDRQMARLYVSARTHADAMARSLLVTTQRDYLHARDRCGGDYACLFEAYEQRLETLGAEADRLAGRYQSFAHFQGDGFAGDLWIGRYGDKGAIMIETVGGGDHTCAYETDAAVVTGRGVVKAEGEQDFEGEACHIDVIPNGEDMDVETKHCSYYCGMRATMDGHYVLTGAASGAQ